MNGAKGHGGGGKKAGDWRLAMGSGARVVRAGGSFSFGLEAAEAHLGGLTTFLMAQSKFLAGS